MITLAKHTAEPDVVAVHVCFKLAGDTEKRPSLSLQSGAFAEASAKMFAGWFTTSQKLAPFLAKEPPDAQNQFVGEQGVYGTCFTGGAIFLFYLTDWRRGAAAIQQEIAALGLLSFTQIVRTDESEGVWRPYFPLDRPPFEPSQLLKELAGNANPEGPAT